MRPGRDLKVDEERRALLAIVPLINWQAAISITASAAAAVFAGYGEHTTSDSSLQQTTLSRTAAAAAAPTSA